MTTKDFSTPSRQNNFDSVSPGEDYPSYMNEYHQNVLNNDQGSTRKKSHNPLCASSSKFQVKSLMSPPFFQDNSGNVFDSTDVTHSSIMSESLSGPTHIPIIEHLDLNNFKVKPCPLNSQHNHKHCPFYHNAKDRKRLGYFYCAELCDFAEKEGVTCPNGDMCQKSHNRVEQLYRQEKYKTKFCTFYPTNLEKCDYGLFCSFAHHENDIIIELIHNYEYDDDFYMFHFKTVWCPFNLTQHDKALCVYAHNWQDYRRKPNIYSYDPAPCSNWKSTDFILNYEDGCPYKEKCAKCHGWKEHEYHPLNFKSKPCPAGKNCAKGRDCPHFHVPRERRITNSNVLNRVFRFVPRNRIITNTFKVRSEERVPYHYNMPNPNVNANHSTSSASTYPSMTFNHENDSLMEQYSALSEQVMNNQSRGSTLNNIRDAPVRSMDFNSNEKDREEQSYENKPRKQSYDVELTRPRLGSGAGASMLSKNEVVPPGLDRSSGKKPPSKPRRWSAHEDGGFSHDSDRLFREIVMSSMSKENNKVDALTSPELKNFEEKDEASTEAELSNNMMLDKILENEDI